MPDTFHTTIIALASQVPDLWLAEDQNDVGLTFTTDRPIDDASAALTAAFETQAWRILDARRINNGTTSRFRVISEIDRTCNVQINSTADPSRSG